jgi:hypothetical protein
MSDLAAKPSNGSARRGIGHFAKAARGATSFDALYAVVGSLARAVDGVRDEIRENTAAVDELCRMVRKLMPEEK